MKLQHRANINIMLSSLIWGVSLNLAVWVSRRFLADDGLFDVLRRGSSIFVLILYPLLVSVILHRKIHLWINAFLFSTAGSLLASLGMLLFTAIQNSAWTDLSFGICGIWLIRYILAPRFEQIPAVQREWRSLRWEGLNESSLLEFAFLQFHLVGDNAG